MKNLDLNKYGVQEMNTNEMKKIDGGKQVPYMEYNWSGTDNPIIYGLEAIGNGCILIANGGIWIWNQFQ